MCNICCFSTAKMVSWKHLNVTLYVRPLPVLLSLMYDRQHVSEEGRLTVKPTLYSCYWGGGGAGEKLVCDGGDFERQHRDTGTINVRKQLLSYLYWEIQKQWREHLKRIHDTVCGDNTILNSGEKTCLELKEHVGSDVITQSQTLTVQEKEDVLT